MIFNRTVTRKDKKNMKKNHHLPQPHPRNPCRRPTPERAREAALQPRPRSPCTWPPRQCLLFSEGSCTRPFPEKHWLSKRPMSPFRTFITCMNQSFPARKNNLERRKKKERNPDLPNSQDFAINGARTLIPPGGYAGCHLHEL